MTGIIIFAIVAVIILISINKKKGTTDMKKPNKISSIITDIPIDKAMKTIINFAQIGGYKVDDFNEKDAIIVINLSCDLY